MKTHKIFNRIKKDLSLTSYGTIYEKFISDLISNKYVISSMSSGLKILNHTENKKKVACLRHDVDTHNVSGNKMFFKIEKKYSAQSTYYFRLKTARSHKKFIDELLNKQFEVGYHFEEASTFMKKNNIYKLSDLLKYKKEIEDNFKLNVEFFRKQYNPNLVSVSAHGDWINRKHSFANYDFVNKVLLKECGLNFEAYTSPMIKKYLSTYLTDTQTSPNSWNYENYLLSHLYILTHEREWYPGPISNTLENISRLVETIIYNINQYK